LLLVGFAVGFLGLNDYLVTGAIGSVPSYVRVSPFVLVLATSFWAVAIFRHQLFGIVPVSRQTVVETMPDPVIVVDDSDTVVDVNPAAKRLFDAPGAVTGTDLATFADTCPTISEYNDEGVGDVDVTIDHDGTTRHFSMKTEPVRDTAAGSVVVLRDVTELKSYEHRLETQRDDLELLNQVIRHDVRNDLQLVLAHTEMAEQKVGDGDVTRHLETVLENTDHAIDLTKTARELTDVMLSPDEPTERVTLRNRLESQIAAVRSAYPGAEIAIDGSIPAVSVRADEMIDSVFRNLLQNAVQHNDQAVPEIEVSAREQAKAVAIRIADNGPGIPDEDKETIFGRGEKGLDSAGTGVGLYLVRMLVDQYGGDVWVEDADPEGAAFVVELPLAS
jgi:signal transduction histidine kinase